MTVAITSGLTTFQEQKPRLQYLFGGVLFPQLLHDQVLFKFQTIRRLLQHVRVVRRAGLRQPRVPLLQSARNREQNAQRNRRALRAETETGQRDREQPSQRVQQYGHRRSAPAPVSTGTEIPDAATETVKRNRKQNVDCDRRTTRHAKYSLAELCNIPIRVYTLICVYINRSVFFF